MTTEVSSGTAVLGIGIGRTPQALQSAIRAVAAIREGAYTTRRNSQLCLLISGRCDLILHAICPLLDPEQHRLGALSHRLRGLVTLSKFESQLAKIIIVIHEEVVLTEQTPEAVQKWSTNHAHLESYARRLYEAPFNELDTSRFGLGVDGEWQEEITKAAKYDRVTWMESLFKSLVEVEKGMEAAAIDTEMRETLDAVRHLHSSSASMWNGDPAIWAAATTCAATVSLAATVMKNQNPLGAPVQWKVLSRAISGVNEAAEKNDGFAAGQISRTLKTFTDSLPSPVPGPEALASVKPASDPKGSRSLPKAEPILPDDFKVVPLPPATSANAAEYYKRGPPPTPSEPVPRRVTNANDPSDADPVTGGLPVHPSQPSIPRSLGAVQGPDAPQRSSGSTLDETRDGDGPHADAEFLKREEPLKYAPPVIPTSGPLRTQREHVDLPCTVPSSGARTQGQLEGLSPTGHVCLDDEKTKLTGTAKAHASAGPSENGLSPAASTAVDQLEPAAPTPTGRSYPSTASAQVPTSMQTITTQRSSTPSLAEVSSKRGATFEVIGDALGGTLQVGPSEKAAAVPMPIKDRRFNQKEHRTSNVEVSQPDREILPSTPPTVPKTIKPAPAQHLAQQYHGHPTTSPVTRSSISVSSSDKSREILVQQGQPRRKTIGADGHPDYQPEAKASNYSQGRHIAYASPPKPTESRQHAPTGVEPVPASMFQNLNASQSISYTKNLAASEDSPATSKTDRSKRDHIQMALSDRPAPTDPQETASESLEGTRGLWIPLQRSESTLSSPSRLPSRYTGDLRLADREVNNEEDMEATIDATTIGINPPTVQSTLYFQAPSRRGLDQPSATPPERPQNDSENTTNSEVSPHRPIVTPTFIAPSSLKDFASDLPSTSAGASTSYLTIRPQETFKQTAPNLTLDLSVSQPPASRKVPVRKGTEMTTSSPRSPDSFVTSEGSPLSANALSPNTVLLDAESPAKSTRRFSASSPGIQTSSQHLERLEQKGRRSSEAAVLVEEASPTAAIGTEDFSDLQADLPANRGAAPLAEISYVNQILDSTQPERPDSELKHTPSIQTKSTTATVTVETLAGAPTPHPSSSAPTLSGSRRELPSMVYPSVGFDSQVEETASRSGRIRVLLKKGETSEEFLGYVSRQVHGGVGVLARSRKVIRDAKDALQVSFEVPTLPAELFGLSTGKDQQIGITWSPRNPTLASGTTDYAAITTVKSETKGAMNKNWQGPTRATIWGMNHRDGTLSPEWEDFKLIPVVNLGKKFEQPLEVVVDFDAFARKYPGWAAVRLVFESD